MTWVPSGDGVFPSSPCQGAQGDSSDPSPAPTPGGGGGGWMARLLKSTVGRQGKEGPKGQMSSRGFYHRAEGDGLQCWWLLHHGESPARALQHPRVAQEPLALSTQANMGTNYFKSHHTERCCPCLGVRGREGLVWSPFSPSLQHLHLPPPSPILPPPAPSSPSPGSR